MGNIEIPKGPKNGSERLPEKKSGANEAAKASRMRLALKVAKPASRPKKLPKTVSRPRVAPPASPVSKKKPEVLNPKPRT